MIKHKLNETIRDVFFNLFEDGQDELMISNEWMEREDEKSFSLKFTKRYLILHDYSEFINKKTVLDLHSMVLRHNGVVQDGSFFMSFYKRLMGVVTELRNNRAKLYYKLEESDE